MIELMILFATKYNYSISHVICSLSCNLYNFKMIKYFNILYVVILATELQNLSILWNFVAFERIFNDKAFFFPTA